VSSGTPDAGSASAPAGAASRADGASRRTRRRSRLGWQLVALIAGLLIVSAAATTWFSVSSLVDTTTVAAESSMANAHRIVADLVTVATNDVDAYRQAALDQRKLELRDISAAMVGAMERLRLAISPDGTNDDAARAAVLDLLRATRYRNEDYFFTLDRDLVMIEHPNPDWDGKPVADFEDPSGAPIFRQMRDVVERDGSGFVPYLWARLGADEPVSKISHVEGYEPWGWIIGTGVYLDDVEAEAASQLDAMTASLAQTFDTIELGESGTIFILDAEGRVAVAPTSRDLSVLETTDEGRAVAQRIIAEAPAGPDEMRSAVETATFATGAQEQWLVDVSSFPELGWTLVSAIPERKLHGPGIALGLRQLLLSLLVLICGLGIGLLASRRIARPIEAMTTAAIDLENDRFDPASLDEAASRGDEVGALARAFRRMGAEVLERERRLREQVERLSISIDRGRVARDVGEITESDFFRDLQSRARDMRRRDQEEPLPAPPLGDDAPRR
jgi:methyl-accepting chemotaxis protein WspA